MSHFLFRSSISSFFLKILDEKIFKINANGTLIEKNNNNSSIICI